jgi:allantoinase
MNYLADARAGARAFKGFLSPVGPEYHSVTLEQARRAMEQIAQTGLRAGFHCEDPQILAQALAGVRAAGEDSFAGFLRSRPVEAEVRAVSGVLAAARQTGAKTHICHVSHPDAAALIRRAQEEGLDVTAETCAHYLIFDERVLLSRGAALNARPPAGRRRARGAWGLCSGWDARLRGLRPFARRRAGAMRKGAALWLSGAACPRADTLQVMRTRCAQGREPRASGGFWKGPGAGLGLLGGKGALEPGFDATARC